VLVVGGDEDDRRRLLGTDGLEDLEAVLLGDLHVQEHEVGRGAADGFERLVAIAALADHVDVGLGLEEGAEPFAAEGLVVHDQGSYLHDPPRNLPARIPITREVYEYTGQYARRARSVPWLAPSILLDADGRSLRSLDAARGPKVYSLLIDESPDQREAAAAAGGRAAAAVGSAAGARTRAAGGAAPGRADGGGRRAPRPPPGRGRRPP